MDHQAKLQRYLEHTDSLGIPRSQAAPALHRLAWRLGIPLAPPLSASFLALALMFGVLFGGLMYLLLNAPFWSPPELAMATPGGAAVGGAIYGLLMAGFMVAKRARHGLPLWKDFE